MHSKIKGTIGELTIARDLQLNGFNVFKELGDLSKIDLIAEKDNKLIKLQVKTLTSKNGCVTLVSKKSGPNYSFRYKLQDVDIFSVYILDLDLIGYISAKELLSQKTLTLRVIKPKNGQCNKIRYIHEFRDINRILRDYTQQTLTDKAEGYDIVQTTTQIEASEN